MVVRNGFVFAVARRREIVVVSNAGDEAFAQIEASAAIADVLPYTGLPNDRLMNGLFMARVHAAAADWKGSRTRRNDNFRP